MTLPLPDPVVALSIDFETLVPILFFVLYGIAQFLGSKKKPGDAGDEEPDVDAEERARQIREEIRRKIEERRKAQQGRQPSAPASAGPVAYDPTKPDGQKRQPAPVRRELRPEPSRRPEPVVVHQPEPVVRQGPTLEQRLEEQRKRLELARKEQAQARAKALRMMGAAKEQQTRSRHQLASGGFRKQLFAGLRKPTSVRQAVLYREILDKPLGLR
jgi:hypothetical protein